MLLSSVLGKMNCLGRKSESFPDVRHFNNGRLNENFRTSERANMGDRSKAQDGETNAKDGETSAQDGETSAKDGETSAQDGETSAQDEEKNTGDAERNSQDVENQIYAYCCKCHIKAPIYCWACICETRLDNAITSGSRDNQNNENETADLCTSCTAASVQICSKCRNVCLKCTTEFTTCICDFGGLCEACTDKNKGGISLGRLMSGVLSLMIGSTLRKRYNKLAQTEDERLSTSEMTSSTDLESVQYTHPYNNWDWDDEDLTCNVCDRAFGNPSLLHQHQVKHRHWGCSSCETLFNTVMELEHHKEELDHWSEEEWEEDEEDEEEGEDEQDAGWYRREDSTHLETCFGITEEKLLLSYVQ